MPSPAKSAALKRPRKSAPSTASVLYLYAISPKPARTEPSIAAEAIDGASKVEAIRCGQYLCWVSRVPKSDFAEHLSEKMQHLEWLAAAGLRHQRAVAEISAALPSLPARFGTVFLTAESLSQHIVQREPAIRSAFQRVEDADEWGVKVFALAAPKPVSGAKAPASGSEYLKRKAELLQPPSPRKLPVEVTEFIAELKRIAIADCPGGKASAGQPGLLWHGSFLIPKQNAKKLQALLEKFARQWSDARRIDCSGPWPPYSFVGDHV